MAGETIESLRQVVLPGGWYEETWNWQGRSFTILRPAQADRFLDALETLPPGEPEPDIYWAQIWSATWPMARWILDHAPWPPGTRVLEIGCGIGVVGLAALAIGCHVTFSDYVPLAVELARANAVRNGFPDAQGIVFDWREPPAQTYDHILACDVLYSREHFQPLMQLISRGLRPGGTAWIADPGRYHVSEWIEFARASQFLVECRGEDNGPLRGTAGGEFQLIRLSRAAEQLLCREREP